MLAEQTDSQEQSDTTPIAGAGTKEEGIIIITVCTLLAFILGVICGLIAYRYISALLKKKADHVQESAASVNTEKSGKRLHYKKSVTNNVETSAAVVYDEIIHYSNPGIPMCRWNSMRMLHMDSFNCILSHLNIIVCAQ